MKNYFRQQIERYADENGVVINFCESGDSFVSEEYFFYKTFPLENVPFLQRYVITDNAVLSLCSFEIDILFDKEVDRLVELLSEKYGPVIKYDEKSRQVTVCYRFKLCEEVTQSDIAYIIYISSIVCRMFACAVSVVCNEGISPEQVLTEALCYEDEFLDVEDIAYYFNKPSGHKDKKVSRVMN